MMLKISKFIYALLLSTTSWLFPTNVYATGFLTDSVTQKSKKPLYTSREAARQALTAEAKANFFNGVSVGVDVVGPVMQALSSRGHIEGMLRVNILETYFPILEIGYSKCNHTDENTFVTYKANAPYFRVGLDVNLAKNKFSGNRIFAGMRYGFTSFEYDVSSQPVEDFIGGSSVPFHLTALEGNKHWAELLFGIETRITSFLQLGWALRYKFGLSEKSSYMGKPWYVPGYGRNKNGTFGANFNIILDF